VIQQAAGLMKNRKEGCKSKPNALATFEPYLWDYGSDLRNQKAFVPIVDPLLYTQFDYPLNKEIFLQSIPPLAAGSTCLLLLAPLLAQGF
jgi:hypothetical protein